MIEKIIDKLILNKEDICKIVKRISEDIAFVYKQEIEVIVIIILDGATNFCKDIFKTFMSENDVKKFHLYGIKAKSYGKNTFSSGQVNLDFCGIKSDLNLKNKRILIIDDICHTGNTLYSVIEEIKNFEPKDIKTCVFLERDEDHVKKTKIDFLGKKIKEKQFLVGYGLDWKENYRDMPDVYTVKKELNNA
jgi:hypoxanthine phosphoribosyltransferase